jgi:3-phenylpropionate/trans-cinnamate dioxygenase ferredoxin subunit
LIETIEICRASELPPGAMRVITHEDLEIAIVNCDGVLYAIEDRCSHDDGPLVEGILDEKRCTIECPRHGSLFDLRTGKPMTLPAYEAIETFPIRVEDDLVKVDLQ